MKLILLMCPVLLLALASPTHANACALGFSFQFAPLPDHYGHEATSIKSFLNKTYAKRGWEWAPSSLSINAPVRPDLNSRIAVSVGSVAPDMLGIYSGFSVFRANRVTVIEFAGEKEVAKRLPSQVPILKMQNFGPYSGKTSKIDSGIEKIADFKLSDLTMPFAKLRIRANGANGIRLFASFFPVDDKAPVQIVRATKDIYGGPQNPCHNKLYVYGKWPKNLRKSYRYE